LEKLPRQAAHHHLSSNSEKASKKLSADELEDRPRPLLRVAPSGAKKEANSKMNFHFISGFIHAKRFLCFERIQGGESMNFS
jgi:hypothetical protein